MWPLNRGGNDFLSLPVLSWGPDMNWALILSTGKSALHWAAAVNNVEATLALLKNGANKDMQDSKVSPWELVLPQPLSVAQQAWEKPFGGIHLAYSQLSGVESGLQALTADQRRTFVVVAV